MEGGRPKSIPEAAVSGTAWKLMHIEQNQREKVDSELRKKEKSERLIKQLADAQLRKDERAERNRKQQDEAQIRRAERASTSPDIFT